MSNFRFETEQTITITADGANQQIVAGNDGDGRRLIELAVMTTGTFGSGTLVIKRRLCDGSTYANPPGGAYSVTTADTAETQIHSALDTETPGAGYFYTLTGSTTPAITLKYNAVWG